MPTVEAPMMVCKALTEGGIEGLLTEAILMVRSGKWVVREVSVGEYPHSGNADLTLRFTRVAVDADEEVTVCLP